MTDVAAELGIDRQKLSMVRVTNRNAFTMRDRFDGNLYTFRPNKPQVIPPMAAMHFFAWPGDPELMKAHTTKRFGWNSPAYVGIDKKHIVDMFEDGEKLGDVYWRNLIIEEVRYNVVPEDMSLPEKEVEPAQALAPASAMPDDELTHSGTGRKGRKVEL